MTSNFKRLYLKLCVYGFRIPVDNKNYAINLLGLLILLGFSLYDTYIHTYIYIYIYIYIKRQNFLKLKRVKYQNKKLKTHFC